jgi:hypothetical protein
MATSGLRTRGVQPTKLKPPEKGGFSFWAKNLGRISASGLAIVLGHIPFWTRSTTAFFFFSA